MLKPLAQMPHDDIDSLLDGHNRRMELEDVAVLLGALKTGLVEAPGEEASRRHLAAIVWASSEAAATRSHARGSAQPARSRARGAKRGIGLRGRLPGLVARAMVAAVALSFLTVGLAFAGVVDLPDPAEDALAKIGVTLPESGSVPSTDQLPADADDTAVAVIGAIETYLPQLQEGTISGCEFGAFVSAAATGDEAEASHCAALGLATASEGEGNAGHASGEQAEVGQSAAHGGSETGDQASSGGRSVAEEASSGKVPEDHPGS
jgi:hypothetical protein